jgi:hypothetical protein
MLSELFTLRNVYRLIVSNFHISFQLQLLFVEWRVKHVSSSPLWTALCEFKSEVPFGTVGQWREKARASKVSVGGDILDSGIQRDKDPIEWFATGRCHNHHQLRESYPPKQSCVSYMAE